MESLPLTYCGSIDNASFCGRCWLLPVSFSPPLTPTSWGHLPNKLRESKSLSQGVLSGKAKLRYYE